MDYLLERVTLAELAESLLLEGLALTSPGMRRDGGARASVSRELERFLEEARAAGHRGDLVEEASYALCAYLDERAAQADLPWEPALCHSFHGSDGRQFFRRLERMKGTPDSLGGLQVFLLCLVLGFEGELREQPEGEQLLLDEVESLQEALAAESVLMVAEAAPEGFEETAQVPLRRGR